MLNHTESTPAILECCFRSPHLHTDKWSWRRFRERARDRKLTKKMKLWYGKTGAEKGCNSCLKMHEGIEADEQGRVHPAQPSCRHPGHHP